MSATEKVVVGCYLQLDKQPRQNGKTLPCARLMDDCDRLKDENDKLREQIHWLKKGDILHVLTDLEFEEQQKHEREVQASITALDDENKQLRELCEYLWEFAKLCGAYHPFLRELGIGDDE